MGPLGRPVFYILQHIEREDRDETKDLQTGRVFCLAWPGLSWLCLENLKTRAEFPLCFIQIRLCPGFVWSWMVLRSLSCVGSSGSFVGKKNKVSSKSASVTLSYLPNTVFIVCLLFLYSLCFFHICSTLELRNQKFGLQIRILREQFSLEPAPKVRNLRSRSKMYQVSFRYVFLTLFMRLYSCS